MPVGRSPDASYNALWVNQALASRILCRELGPGCEIDRVLGNAFVASWGPTEVVLKHSQPPAVLARLAELGVTPEVLACGQFEGVPFTIQRMVRCDEPDAAWFARHVADVADLIAWYQRDSLLAGLLRDDPSREHLTVDAAARMFDQMPARAGSPFWTDEVCEARAEWRRQAGRLAEVAPVPVHADPMAGNYVVEGDRPYLIDWDEVDLSDPWRDVGVQLCWHVPAARWPEFVERCGARLDDELRARIYWWMAFKSLRSGFWVDARGHEVYAAANARGFLAAMAWRYGDGRPRR
jgi:Phosphotransferase enzyme family